MPYSESHPNPKVHNIRMTGREGMGEHNFLKHATLAGFKVQTAVTLAGFKVQTAVIYPNRQTNGQVRHYVALARWVFCVHYVTAQLFAQSSFSRRTI